MFSNFVITMLALIGAFLGFAVVAIWSRLKDVGAADKRITNIRYSPADR